MSERRLGRRPRHELRHIGPNYAADAVVLADTAILLIKRGDTGLWALPGGFIDTDETALTASTREIEEETGLIVSSPGREIFKGKVRDPRNTASRWIESIAFLYNEPTTGPVRGHDDAMDADWHDCDNLPAQMHGSHQQIIDCALWVAVKS